MMTSPLETSRSSRSVVVRWDSNVDEWAGQPQNSYTEDSLNPRSYTESDRTANRAAIPYTEDPEDVQRSLSVGNAQARRPQASSYTQQQQLHQQQYRRQQQHMQQQQHQDQDLFPLEPPTPTTATTTPTPRTASAHIAELYREHRSGTDTTDTDGWGYPLRPPAVQLDYFPGLEPPRRPPRSRSQYHRASSGNSVVAQNGSDSVPDMHRAGLNGFLGVDVPGTELDDLEEGEERQQLEDMYGLYSPATEGGISEDSDRKLLRSRIRSLDSQNTPTATTPASSRPSLERHISITVADARSNRTFTKTLSLKVEQRTVAIIGTGGLGVALGRRLAGAGYAVSFGSRTGILRESSLLPPNTEVTTQKRAILVSEIVVFAVPAAQVVRVCQEAEESLAHKIVVDASNPGSRNFSQRSVPSMGEIVESLLPKSRVVKCFNACSGEQLTASDLAGGPRSVHICGKSSRAKAVIAAMVYDIGMQPVDLGDMRSSWRVESLTTRFFPGWSRSLLSFLLLFVLFLSYTTLRDFSSSTSPSSQALPWSQYSLSATSLVLASISLLLFAGLVALGELSTWTYLRTGYSSLAGADEAMGGVTSASGSVSLPSSNSQSFMSWANRARQPLLLLAFSSAMVHSFIALIQLASRDAIIIPLLNSAGSLSGCSQWALLFAVLSLPLFSSISLSHLPSLRDSLSWPEWTFVQKTLSFLALSLAFCHLILIFASSGSWTDTSAWPRGLPPLSLFVMILVGLVLLCKFVSVLWTALRLLFGGVAPYSAVPTGDGKWSPGAT